MTGEVRKYGTLMDELRAVAVNEAMPLMTRLDAALARLRTTTALMEDPGHLLNRYKEMPHG